MRGRWEGTTLCFPGTLDGLCPPQWRTRGGEGYGRIEVKLVDFSELPAPPAEEVYETPPSAKRCACNTSACLNSWEWGPGAEMFGRSPDTLTTLRLSIAKALKHVLARQSEKDCPGMLTALPDTCPDSEEQSCLSSVGLPCLRDETGVSCCSFTGDTMAMHYDAIKGSGLHSGTTQDPHDRLSMRTNLTNLGDRTNPNISAGPGGGQRRRPPPKTLARATLTPICSPEREQGGRRASGAHPAKGVGSSPNRKGVEAPGVLELVDDYSWPHKSTVWGLFPCDTYPPYYGNMYPCMLFIVRLMRWGPGAGMKGWIPDSLTTSETSIVKHELACEGNGRVLQYSRGGGPNSPSTRNKGTMKECMQGVKGIQFNNSEGRVPGHLRWVVRYIRRRKGARSERFDIRVCEVMVTMNSCVTFVGSLAAIQYCGVLVQWIG